MVAVLFLATGGASVASATMLTVTLGGAGAGAVTSVPAGINCSNVPGAEQTNCSADFPFLVTVKLTAVGAEGSVLRDWAGTAGGTCVGTSNPCETGFVFFTPLDVVATFAPKPDPPVATTGSASNVEFPSAHVAGTVNPGSDDFSVQDCRFEYGLTTDYGASASCRPGANEIGTGTSPVSVAASIGVLEPGQTYHYRLVASNAGGAGAGEDRTFVSAQAPPDNCPNAPFRAEQGALAQRLPDCRAYELVSPLFTAGQSAALDVGTADGNSAMLSSIGGFAGTENITATAALAYVTSRTSSGWTSSAIAPPARDFPYMFESALDWTRDGSRSLWFMNLRADEGTQSFTPIVRDPDGSFHIAGATQHDVGVRELEVPAATSADLSTVVQWTYTRAPLTDGTSDSRSTSVRSLYTATRRANGQLDVRQVAFRAGATMFPTCEVTVGGASPQFLSSATARNAVSSDGRKIFFTAASQGCNDPEAQRVWAKVDDDDPVDLSASLCSSSCGPVRSATFRGASRDGSRVYFTTEQRLLPEDQDTSNLSDLYEYDFNASGQKLRLVTGGTDPEGAGVLTDGDQTLFRVSDDGAYVYFVADGRPLAGQNARGVTPQVGDKNLYVYHRAAGQANGTTTFIGARASTDASNYPQTSSSGRFLLFLSAADLLGERLSGDAFQDQYRYDAQDDDLRRVWSDDPAHNGASRVAGHDVTSVPETSGGIPSGGMQRVSGGWYRRLQLSDDGSKVGFSTAEPLSPDDHNTRTDAYLWEAETGQITMLTDGTSAPGNQFNASQFVGMTPSGDSLFVASASPLLREHTSGQNAVYVVRKNGGFPAPVAPDPPCSGDGCQPPGEQPPGLGGQAGTSTFAGPGNLLTTPPTAATVRVGKVGSVRGSSVRLSVKVSAKGKIQVSGSNLTRTSVSAGKAGSFKVVAKLSKAGKRTLRRKGRVKTRATVRFAPTSGSAVRTRVSLAFTAKVKKAKAKASPRAARELSVLSTDVQKGR